MRKAILVLLVVATAYNSLQLFSQVLSHQTHPVQAPFHSLGDKFKGLETVFNDVRTVGYYTDKNTEEPLVIAQFEQAQYHLAPTVLDLNHTDYPFVILDCSSPQVTLAKIQELQLQPIKINNFGIVLALNPRFAKPNS